MTYYDYLDLTKDFKNFPIAGVNKCGEHVIITHRNGDDPYFQVSTLQTNGWIRINNYYKDGSTDEIYKK